MNGISNKPGRLALLTVALPLLWIGFFLESGKAEPLSPPRWNAGPDLLARSTAASADDYSFTLAVDGASCQLDLNGQGRRLHSLIAVEALPSRLPLDDRPRLRDPFGTLAELRAREPFVNHGWNIWGARPTAVLAAGAGKVVMVRLDPRLGPVIEIDHGYGLRSRYGLGSYGSSAVKPGDRVQAGQAIGSLGSGTPDDIPYLHFGILYDAGDGSPIALDPTPFYLLNAEARATAFAAALLNQAIRAGDQDRVSALLSLGINPNVHAGDGTLPLEWAVMMHRVAIAHSLVLAGGDPSAATASTYGRVLPGLGPTIAHQGPSILELAVDSGDQDLITALSR
ncbi:MAG TPA: peptidoglycan DD-metalloendopeptidase family protein [Rectinemataceae bacterium]|nr:peptidoglycan DD-metalloendopeptidase family protein [Rectinemataceae bacterium]